MSADHHTLRQAAEWFAILQAGEVAEHDRRRWEEWLAASPKHREAWEKVEAIQGQLKGLPAAPARAALDGADAGRRRALKVLGSLAVAAPALWLARRHLPWDTWTADYRTGVGEIRDARLADGTRLWLNTASALDVRYSGDRRRLRLHAGEAMLEPAPDARPLVLHTRHGSVQPVGTRFGVRLGGAGDAVYVEHGALRLQPATGEAVRLAAGRAARLTTRGVDRVRPLATGTGAWTRGLLIANGERLGDLLAELARYHRGWLGWSDAVADLRVIGTYPVDDTERVLAALEDSLPVRVQWRTRWWARVELRE